MSTHASSSRAFSNLTASDGRIGALAALVVLFLDLLWRVTLAPTGTPSFPESVVAAVARLTPTAIFGWATESFGSLAQNTLWAIVLVGVVGMGYWAGQFAGQLVRFGRFGTGVTGRLSAAIIVAVMLFLIITGGGVLLLQKPLRDMLDAAELAADRDYFVVNRDLASVLNSVGTLFAVLFMAAKKSA